MPRPSQASRENLHGIARALSCALVIALAGLVTGCAQNSTVTELPDLVKDPRKFLTKDEQKRAISDLGQGKDAEVTAAEKQIEKSH